MDEKLTVIKKIGNFVAGALLGNTREVIARTDERVQAISRTLENRVEPDLKDIRERFAGVEAKVNTLWADRYATAQSPRQLNPRGTEILTKSGIKDILLEKRAKLFEMVRASGSANAYDAEQAILSVVADLPKHFPETVGGLKDGAFRTGSSIETVLFVGGLYLRNEIFPELGFRLEQLDSK